MTERFTKISLMNKIPGNKSYLQPDLSDWT